MNLTPPPRDTPRMADGLPLLHAGLHPRLRQLGSSLSHRYGSLARHLHRKMVHHRCLRPAAVLVARAHSPSARRMDHARRPAHADRRPAGQPVHPRPQTGAARTDGCSHRRPLVILLYDRRNPENREWGTGLLGGSPNRSCPCWPQVSSRPDSCSAPLTATRPLPASFPIAGSNGPWAQFAAVELLASFTGAFMYFATPDRGSHHPGDSWPRAWAKVLPWRCCWPARRSRCRTCW